MPCSITKVALDCILPASKLRIGLLPLIPFRLQPCGISWQACTKKLLLSLIDVLTNLAKNAKNEDEIMIEISSPQQPVETKIITRKRLLTNVTMSRWSLPTILVFQALLCWILLKNTAFEDEALYIYAGEQIWQHWLHGLPLLENYSYFISGNPYVYPIIAGPLDMLGGLELVRSFSLACMLIVTSCGYYVTKQLFDQKSAIFAAIFFVCQGPVLFLSRLATYDSLCLCLVAIGMALAVNASLAQRPWRALGIGPFLVLAFFAKYAALLSLAVVGTLGAIVVIRFDPSMLHALVASTTDRIVNQEYSRLSLAEHVVQMVGLSYAVGLAGLVFARKKHLLIALVLLGSALLIPAYHIYKAELISVDKHLGYSMFFVMPVAGYALASLSGFRRAFSPGRYWLSGVAICLILFLVGIGEAQSMYSDWPPATQLTYVFKTQVRSATGRYLTEQFEILRYYLADDTYTCQWTGPYFFEYTDKQGHYYIGNEAYVKAINDGYFDLIELNYGNTIQTDLLIAQAIEHSKKYDLIQQIPNRDSYGTGYFFIWRKR